MMMVFQFSEFIDRIKNQILTLAANEPRKFNLKTTAIQCEKIVVEASAQVINDCKLNCRINYTEGGYAFPDIVYVFDSGNKFGIEVKSSVKKNSSEKNWTTLGNSILGSTRIEVIELYIVFIKINNNGVFVNSGRYEDCIADVVVTHSPRYKINLEQNSADSFFVKSGISYNEITNSRNPIRLITDYFKSRGETAWWLSESTSAIIRDWGYLSAREQAEIYGKSFVLFPELLSTRNSIKYKRFAKWLASSYSIVDSSLRDKFTAGGKVTLYVNENVYNDFPKVCQIFQEFFPEFKKAISMMELTELQDYWCSYKPLNDSLQDRKEFWFMQMRENLKDQYHILIYIEQLLSEIN